MDLVFPLTERPFRGTARPFLGRESLIRGLDRPFLLPEALSGRYAAAVSNPEGAMRQGEYERRRRALEAQFHEDVELLRAGYQAKLRALEMVWLASPEEALPVARPALDTVETLRLSETVPASETLPVRETLPPAPEPPARRRGQIAEDVEDILPELPEEFDKNDVVRLLGYEAPRATLHRVFSQLMIDGYIAMAHHSDGHTPTRYRKLLLPLEEDDGRR